MRAHFRDEKEKILSLSRLALFLDPEAEPKKNAPGRGQHEAEPFFSLQCADVRSFPGIEDLGLEGDHRGRDDDDRKEGQCGRP